jgi:3-oxoacyl-[acyl-carrier protein] reductase
VNSNEFADKVFLITGASRGIGAAFALALGPRGAKVAVHYRTGKAEAEEIARRIEESGGSAFTLQGDLAEKDTADRLVDQTAARFGRLDFLINNAGDQIERRSVTDTPDELFDRHININVRPTFAACRAGIRQFRRQGGGGCIVNVGSVAGRTGGGGGSSLYAGAKAFIATFSRALAKELAPESIRVNVISPGVIATDMQDRLTPPEQLKAAVGQIPLRRIGTPEECVGTFLYLCSEELSGYLTGQVIEVNGGLVMP